MENKRKIAICLFAGIGMETWEFYKVRPTVPDSLISAFAYHKAIEWAESYGIYYPGDAPDEADYEEGDEDAFQDAMDEWDSANHNWEQVEGYFEEYNPDEHDGHSMTGTPEFQEFQ